MFGWALEVWPPRAVKLFNFKPQILQTGEGLVEDFLLIKALVDLRRLMVFRDYFLLVHIYLETFYKIASDFSSYLEIVSSKLYLIASKGFSLACGVG